MVLYESMHELTLLRSGMVYSMLRRSVITKSPTIGVNLSLRHHSTRGREERERERERRERAHKNVVTSHVFIIIINKQEHTLVSGNHGTIHVRGFTKGHHE